MLLKIRVMPGCMVITAQNTPRAVALSGRARH
ncbi:hypothetical protein [Dickeya dadantii]